MYKLLNKKIMLIKNPVRIEGVNNYLLIGLFIKGC